MAPERRLIELLPRLRRFALVLARTQDAADELVQVSVERALTRLDHCQPGSRFDRWMFQVMKNVWLNSRRAAAIRETDSLNDDVDTHAMDGVAAAEARVTLREVRAAFDRLPAEQRQALYLVSIEGYTYNEAAEHLGVPMGTVISRLVRGRAALVAGSGERTTNVTPLMMGRRQS